MKKKMLRVVSVVMCLMMVFSLAACGGNSSQKEEPAKEEAAEEPAEEAAEEPAEEAAEEPAEEAATDGEVYEIAIARNLPEADAISQSDIAFGKMLEERSNGRFKFTYYGNYSLVGNDTEALEKVADGTIQFTSTTAATCAAYSSIPEFNVFNEPYIMNTEDELWTLGESEYMQGLYDKFRDATGVIISPNGFSMGWYGYGTVKKDITDITQMSGLKMRVANVPQQLAITEALGAAPTSINWNEIFTTLQQGTVDGIMLTAGLLYNNGFYEALKYYKNCKICSCYHMFIINEAWYNSLPDDLRQIFDECLTEITQTYRTVTNQAEIDAIKGMEEADIQCMEMTEAEQELLMGYGEEIWKNPDQAMVDKEVINTVLDILGKADKKID